VADRAVFVSAIVCEAVLCEKGSEVMSAIRIMDSLKLSPTAVFAHFFVLTFFHAGAASDISNHVATVQMWGPASDSKSRNWGVVAKAPDYAFTFTSKDPSTPKGFCLTTEFNVNLAELGKLGTYFIQIFLDQTIVAQSPLTLQH
jgi:hypothetical protein